MYEFFLDMNSWRKFRSRYNLAWGKVAFNKADHAKVPIERGIYVFTLEFLPSKLPHHGYILYVGITGNDSQSQLHRRFGQYLNHLKNQDGRPAVFFMLDNWGDHLFFNFAPLPDAKVDLVKMERAFINAVRPPVNKRDLEASIAAAKSAVF